MVRIHPDPPIQASSGEWPGGTWAGIRKHSGNPGRGCSSIGRAPALQAGGRRFDPVQLHQHPGQQQTSLYLSIAVTGFRCGHARSACPKLKAVALFNNLEGKACMNLMRVRAR
jgi:hypothetical protein